MTKQLSGGYKTYRLADIQRHIRYYPLDIMLVGATGAGKSSTLNALLQDEKAKVGYGADPETVDIQDYALNDYIRLWDTPGLGDNPEKDKKYFKKIEQLLTQQAAVESDEGETYLIDLVLVLIDGSNRDNGTVTKLLNEVIFKAIAPNRVLIVINQADMAMKGHHWQENNPDDTLNAFLEEKAVSIQRRIAEDTGKSIYKPICISAVNNFNLYSLLDYIIGNYKWIERNNPAHNSNVKRKGDYCKSTANERLGILYYKNRNFKQALKYLKNCNSMYALFYCGKIFQYGNGVNQDLTKAQDYLRKSMNMGHIGAKVEYEKVCHWIEKNKKKNSDETTLWWQ